MHRWWRYAFICPLAFVWIVGCAKSDDRRPQAERAQSGLMPADWPAAGTDYVADQTKVVSLAAPSLSFEPLDSFRAANARRAAARMQSHVAAPAAEAMAPDAAAAGGGGFWTRVGLKTLMGGAAPPAAQGDASAPPTSDEAGADSADDDSSVDGGDSEDDEWDDDEWEEDDSDGE
jgi:hypothetical protein